MLPSSGPLRTRQHHPTVIRGEPGARERARRVRRAETGRPATGSWQGVLSPTQYIPFDADAANLLFQLISSRYERASVIMSSNKPFSRWGEVFGDPIVAAAMIDRLVHHADVINLKGDSYRLKDRALGRIPTTTPPDPARGVNIQRWQGVNLRPLLTVQASCISAALLLNFLNPTLSCVAGGSSLQMYRGQGDRSDHGVAVHQLLQTGRCCS